MKTMYVRIMNLVFFTVNAAVSSVLILKFKNSNPASIGI